MMSLQQNFTNPYQHTNLPHTTPIPILSKIDNEAYKFKTLVSQLRINKRKSACDPLFNNVQSDLEISGIEHRSENYEKNSFELDLQTDLTVKKKGFAATSPMLFKDREVGKDSGDKGLRSKPRSSVNGRDDIRIRNLNETHRKIVEQLEKRRHQSQDHKGRQSSLADFDSHLEQILNPEKQRHPSINLSKFRKSRVTQFTPNIKDNSTEHQSQQKTPFYTERMGRVKDHQRNKSSNHSDSFLQIEGKPLLDFLLRISDQSYPCSESSPNQIYTFFFNICQSFGVGQYFHEPLIKRYKNCVYFGEKISVSSNAANYMGFVWYYRKALYYGEFFKGRKNGYGIEVDIEESGSETIWKGNFQQGKKTGYFQMSNPQMTYNGSMVNSYFDGEGELNVAGKSVYKGNFQAGMKNGYGVETFLNTKSLVYKGEYIDNKFEGKGILEGPNYYFQGNFRSGKPHGDGFERTNQFEYVGQFRKGKREGRGTLKMKTGEVYQGMFEEGRIVEEQSSGYQYVKNIPIQGFSKNSEASLPSLSPSKKLPEPTSLKFQHSNPPPSRPPKSTASPRIAQNRNEPSPIRLSKYISKDLAALDEQNEEGTLEQPADPSHQPRYSGFKMQRVEGQRWATREEQDDQEEPLQSRVLQQY